MPAPQPARPASMWEEVVMASLWISSDFQWIWVDFLHVDSHLYLYYLQSIYRRQILTAKPCLYFPDFTPFTFVLPISNILWMVLRGEATVDEQNPASPLL